MSAVLRFLHWLIDLFATPAPAQSYPIKPPSDPVPVPDPAVVNPPDPSPGPVWYGPRADFDAHVAEYEKVHPGAPMPVYGGLAAPGVKPQSRWWKGTYKLTQAYGCTDLTMEGHNPSHPECAYFHEGMDFALPCGTPIYAPIPLHVMAVDPPGYGPVGNSAAIRLGDYGYEIWLYHMRNYAVKTGDHLRPGDLIGWSGTRGYSTGCHIHFEVRPAGGAYRSSINPAKFLQGA